jgi:acid stress-induced BolA-like protein IbaG/YrbA
VPTPRDLEILIAAALPGARVRVEDSGGTGDHFQATVQAEQFRGRTLVEQHQMVYAALEDLLTSRAIHALSIKTSSPDS